MNSKEALEVKDAFLEETVSTMSEEFFVQQKELEELKKQMNLLVEKLKLIQSSDKESAEILDEKPPHY